MALRAAAFTLVFQLAASIPAGGTMAEAGANPLVAGFRAVFVGIAVAGVAVAALALALGSYFPRPGQVAR